MFGWMLAIVGVVPLVLAYRAILSGEVSVGDKVSQTRYTRDDSPGSFWFGVVFYVLLGVSLMVAGVLAAVGILE